MARKKKSTETVQASAADAAAEPRKIVIDDLAYPADNLSERARALISSLQFVDARLISLRNELIVCQTSQRSYALALKEELPEGAST